MSLHWLLHIVCGALLRGLIYLEIWKVGKNLSALDVGICIIALIVGLMLFRLVWRLLFGRRYYRRY